MNRPGAGLIIWGGVAVLLAQAPSVAWAAATPQSGRGIITLPLADTVERGRVEMGLWLGGVFHDGQSATLGGPMGAALGFGSRGELTLSTRMTSPVDPERAWRGIDPVRLGAKWRLFDEQAIRPGVAVDLGFRYVKKGFDLLPRLILQKSYAPLLGVIAVGFDGAMGATGDQRRALTLGVGAQGTFGEFQTLFEVSTRFSEPQGYGMGATHVSAGGAYEAGSGVQFSAVITGGFGPEAASLRLLIGLVIGTSTEREIDHDHDGVPDLVDRCIFEPEDLDRIEDEDGCPEGDPDRLVLEVEKSPRFTTPRPRFRMRIRNTWKTQDAQDPQDKGDEQP